MRYLRKIREKTRILIFLSVTWKYGSVKTMQLYSVFHALSNGVVFIDSAWDRKFASVDMHRKSGYCLPKPSKFWANSAHLRTRPRYWWDKAVVKISWRSDEFFGSYRVNGRTATLTDFRVSSLFEYTKSKLEILKLTWQAYFFSHNTIWYWYCCIPKDEYKRELNNDYWWHESIHPL